MMCRNGKGDSWTSSSAWVDFPVPGVPVMTMTGKVFVVEVMLCGQPLSGSVLIDKDDGPIVETARSMVEKYFQYYLSAGPS